MIKFSTTAAPSPGPVKGPLPLTGQRGEPRQRYGGGAFPALARRRGGARGNREGHGSEDKDGGDERGREGRVGASSHGNPPAELCHSRPCEITKSGPAPFFPEIG